MKRILITAMILGFGQMAHASKLPDDVWGYVKKQIPNATQRFDSVIENGDGTMYIPLYPAQRAEVAQISSEFSYPSGKNLAQRPEVVILNNNFVLLKLFKDSSGSYTITQNESLPMKVKLGVMPQDMLVPAGLKIPESLKLVMGDLIIPQRGDNLVITATDMKMVNAKSSTEKLIPLTELKDKKTIIAGSQSKFVLVYDGSAKGSFYELKLNGLPSKIIASEKSKFALVTYFASKNIEVIDLNNERVLTQIALEFEPKDADLDELNNIAYVSSPLASTIYAVDLNSGKLAKTIKLDQQPGKITVAKNGESLVYVDVNSEKLYELTLDNECASRYLMDTKNAAKVVYENKNVYVVSRTDNKVTIFSTITNEIVNEVRLDQKPVDALVYNDKIYILCAQDGIVNVYDMKLNKIVNTVAIGESGFYSKITVVPNQTNAIITGIHANKFILFDLETMAIAKKQNAQVDVSSITIIDTKPSKDNL